MCTWLELTSAKCLRIEWACATGSGFHIGLWIAYDWSKLEQPCKGTVNEIAFSEHIVMYLLREVYPLSIPKHWCPEHLSYILLKTLIGTLPQLNSFQMLSQRNLSQKSEDWCRSYMWILLLLNTPWVCVSVHVLRPWYCFFLSFFALYKLFIGSVLVTLV